MPECTPWCTGGRRPQPEKPCPPHPHPWTGQSGPAPPAGRTSTSPTGRAATAAPRDGASHATDPAAKPSSHHETEFPSGTGRPRAGGAARGSRHPSTTPPDATSPAAIRHGKRSRRSASSPQAEDHPTSSRAKTGPAHARTPDRALQDLCPGGTGFRHPQRTARPVPIPEPAPLPGEGFRGWRCFWKRRQRRQG